MGKQIRFFATKKDLESLVDLIKTNEAIMINSIDEIQDTYSGGKVFIKLKNSELFYWKDGKIYEYSSGHILDPFSSDIIEFDACRIAYDQDKNIYRYEHGRFWYETSYFDNDERIIRKNKDLDKLFNKFKRYIIKNYIISTDKFGYIGPDAYEEYKKGFIVPCQGKYEFNFPKT